MSEYLQLKGRLSELKQTRMDAVIRAEAHASGLKQLLALAEVDEITALRTDRIASLAADLHVIATEIREIDEKIASIKRHLGQ